jgi:hypothetical protein
MLAALQYVGEEALLLAAVPAWTSMHALHAQATIIEPPVPGRQNLSQLIDSLDVAHPYDSGAALDTALFFNGSYVGRQSDDGLGVLAQGRREGNNGCFTRRPSTLTVC